MLSWCWWMPVEQRGRWRQQSSYSELQAHQRLNRPCRGRAQRTRLQVTHDLQMPLDQPWSSLQVMQRSQLTSLPFKLIESRDELAFGLERSEPQVQGANIGSTVLAKRLLARRKLVSIQCRVEKRPASVSRRTSR